MISLLVSIVGLAILVVGAVLIFHGALIPGIVLAVIGLIVLAYFGNSYYGHRGRRV